MIVPDSQTANESLVSRSVSGGAFQLKNKFPHDDDDVVAGVTTYGPWDSVLTSNADGKVLSEHEFPDFLRS